MSLYDDLEIPKNATPDEIKKAGRDAAKKHHPDKPGGDHEKFVKSQTALRVLIDPDRRAHYDRTGEEGSSNPQDMERAKAQEVIAQLMNEIMTGDARYTNLPKMILAKLDEGIFELNAQTALAETNFSAKMQGVESYLKRLKKKKKTKDGDDILRGMLEAQKAELVRQQRVIKDDSAMKIRVIKRAQAMMGGYEYEVDAGPAQSQYGGYQAYGSYTGTNDMLRTIQDLIRKGDFR